MQRYSGMQRTLRRKVDILQEIYLILEMIEMTEKIDLESIEKKAWKTFYAEDGLYDIFFGIMIFVSAVRTLTDIPWLTLGILLGVLVISLGKRYITTPRVGRVKFGPKRMGKMIILTGGIGVAIVITSFLFFITVYSGDFPRILASFLMMAMIIIVFGLMAYYLDNFRDFIYGILFALHEFVWVIYGRTIASFYFLFLGTILLFVGFLVLIRFLQRYPKPDEEVANDL
jgi:hypothetical protein